MHLKINRAFIGKTSKGGINWIVANEGKNVRCSEIYYRFGLLMSEPLVPRGHKC